MTDSKEQAQSLFLNALEIATESEQEAYVAAECGDDGELRREVEELLDHAKRLGGFLDPGEKAVSPTVDQPISEQAGTQIGPYKLLQEIGEGGFGVVYMAEQMEPVRRKVALKIIKPGMDTKQVIARFEAERQALAMMDHPNIAKVLDAGATESGRPYFVMELVKGVPVTQYCDEQHLTPKERLELFVPICQAVQHAHQKGIIHRDLKPSNILVALYDGQAVSKVIDFGVAKATSQTLTEKTMFTQLGQVVGTLEYMSPEQAQVNQLDIDTRSDVYSLGVLLYELLTGDTPFDRQRLRSAAFDEMLRIIREEEPPKPSTKISSSEALPSIAANRHVDPQRLTSSVRGELDWIVMKALEKDRDRRYETASKFAEDVQHYLADEPVVACPPSASYRFKKFARRNRGLLTATTAVAVVLLAGSVVSTAQAIRATNAEQAEAAERRKAEQERGRAERERENARVQEQQAKRNLQLATVEQRRAEGNLDLALAALDAVYLDAIGRDKLLGEPVAKPDEAANSPPNFGQPDFRLQSPPPPLTDLERELLKRGLGFYDRFAQQNAAAGRAFVQTAQAYYRVGLLQAGLGETEYAATSFRSAINRFERLTKEEPENAQHFRRLAEAYESLANVVPEWSEAKENFDRSRAAYSKAIEAEPNHWLYWQNRGLASFKLEDDAAAVEDFSKVLELYPAYHSMLSWRCAAYVRLGQLDRAQDDCAALLESNAKSHYNHYQHALLTLASNNEAQYRDSCQTMLDALAETEDPMASYFAAWTCSLAPDAVEDYQPAIALATKALEAEPASDDFVTTLAAILYRAGRHDEAIERLTEVSRRLEGPEHRTESSPAYTWYILAMAHQTAGNKEQAREYLNKANQWTDELLADKENPPAWNRRTTLEILRKEAEALLESDDQESADSDPKPELESNAKTKVGQDRKPD